MHTDLHLVTAQYHRHLYLLQPVSATAAVTGKAATVVLAEANSSSAHHSILMSVYLRSDPSRKLSVTNNKLSIHEACYDRATLPGVQVHSFFSITQ